MLGLAVTIVDEMQRVADAAKAAEFRNLSHAAAAIRKTEIESIKPASGPSRPGEPPHTHTAGLTKSGKNRKGVLPKSIAYDVDKTAGIAVIGPRASIVGEAGGAMEHGGEFRGDEYPARPFAAPALEQNLDRFAQEWAGSVGM